MVTVTLRDDFYRDSFKKTLLLLLGSILIVVFLGGLLAYYILSKPWPVVFAVEERWQVQPPVNIIRPFISQADLLQWVSEVVPTLFELDFLNYDDQVAIQKRNFTANGWHVYQNQLKNFAPKDTVINDHEFITTRLIDAPAVIKRGILSGRYAWMVNLPMAIDYFNLKERKTRIATFQILIVRVPTENNLAGVAIDDIVVAKSA